MAAQTGRAPTMVQTRIETTPSPEEQELLYTELLRLRDLVVQGAHPLLKLPPKAIESLKSTRLTVSDTTSDATNAFIVAVNQQPSGAGHSLPGLHPLAEPLTNGHAFARQAKSGAEPAGLDPIFLEKSDSLVRAEGQLKRQRLERDLQSHVDQRKHSARGRDSETDALSAIDVDGILRTALGLVPPISGLKRAMERDSPESSVFDENDYYSSLVQSDWSSDASPSKESDKATDTFPAEHGRLGEMRSLLQPAAHRDDVVMHSESQVRDSQSELMSYSKRPENVFEVEDEDDEYTPPDAAAIDSSRLPQRSGQMTSADDDDDDSDYEPGEITQDSNYATPQNHSGHQTTQGSPRVPLMVRNHLTHIAAPQPNRVSPLATAKGPNIQLELVNGRPEIVQKPLKQSQPGPSRASTASTPANAAALTGKRKRNKRKREADANTRAKRRRERRAAHHSSPRGHDVKDEPVTPPPFAPDPPHFLPESQYRTITVDGRSPRVISAPHDSNSYQAVQLRSETLQPVSSQRARLVSPVGYRPFQRKSQDLRRVATLHHSQRPASPTQPGLPPSIQYRAASMAYGDHRQTLLSHPDRDVTGSRFIIHDDVQSALPQIRTERIASPPRLRDYAEPYYQQEPSPAMMPPPKRIVVDQYGNRYYAAEPVAPTPVVARASAVPVERTHVPGYGYERASSRVAQSYVGSSARYDPERSQLLPSGSMMHSSQIEPLNDQGYRLREYDDRPVESPRYLEPAASTQLLPADPYLTMPPPPVESDGETTSPIYQQFPRSYSVRPRDPRPVEIHASRQVSVAPGAFAPREAMQAPPQPVRAISVMPGAEYAPAQPTRMYSQAPPGMRFVDRYGNEVFASQVRQVYQ